MSVRINQMALVSGVLKLLGKQGLKSIHSHQLNAVIAGVNLMLKDLNRAFVPATYDMGLTAWLNCDDTGTSSLYMAHVLAGAPRADYGHPLDPSDFGRCTRFLDAVPGARVKMHLLAASSNVWAGLVAAWPELEALYMAEAATGAAPRLYARMKEIIEAAAPKESMP